MPKRQLSRKRSPLPELDLLESLLDSYGNLLRVDELVRVNHQTESLPVYAVEFGNQDAGLPAIAFVGGVHGRERIGSQVVLSFLETLLKNLSWDGQLQSLLEHLRVVFIPILNPGGMRLNTRANLNGVDLMRNAPVEADGYPLWPLGGHRLSKALPWYRGEKGAPMEAEAQALVTAIRERLLPAPFSIALDCHSGFGAQNRIWFPYARSRERIPHLAEVYALRNLFREAYPNHVHYRIEPQSASYTTHGDLWDYLYDHSLVMGNGPFLPLTLEMGSWLWIRQYPHRYLHRLDIFNPLEPLLHKRILRQHLVWFDFLLRAVASNEQWRPTAAQSRDALRQAAKRYWWKTGNKND